MRDQEDEKPIALGAYEALAERYAALVDSKAENAYYERPATLSLLPDVEGKRVLDAGCGPGSYSEWLVVHGAEVMAIDVSPKMVQLAKRRLGTRAEICQADLSKPLDFLEDESFDLVLCPLVLDYIRDWKSVFTEFCRILRESSLLIFEEKSRGRMQRRMTACLRFRSFRSLHPNAFGTSQTLGTLSQTAT